MSENHGLTNRDAISATHVFVAETHAMAIIDDIQSQIYERRTAAAWKPMSYVDLSQHT